MQLTIGAERGAQPRLASSTVTRWQPRRGTFAAAWLLARREIRDLTGDWRIMGPALILTFLFPLLLVLISVQGRDFLLETGSTVSLDRIVPFALMVVGFFPISFSLMMALESFAGEKERNSLEALLASPLSDAALYLGKILSALLPPLVASFISMSVYLSGLLLVSDYNPNWPLLASLLLINFSAALVMVSSAVLVSSHTTSVRAANLLASFIILPMSVLIQLNNLLVLWGAEGVLWLVALAIGAVGVLLLRGGMNLFSRELLLAREMDDLRPSGLWRTFKSFLALPPHAAIALRSRGSVAGERFSWLRLYRHDIPVLLRLRLPELGIVTVALVAAYLLGWFLSSEVNLGGSLLGELAGVNADPTLPASADGGFMGSLLASFPLTLLRMVTLGLLLAVLAVISFGLLPILLMMAVAGGVGMVLGVLSQDAFNSPLMLLAVLSPPVLLPALAFCIFTAFALRIGLSLGSPPAGFSLGDSLLLSLAEFLKLSALAIPLLALGILMQSILLALA